MTSLMESNPLVSVIMPTYNTASLIGETINSVRAQTYRNLEIIVVDDGSTDNTETVVLHIAAQDARVIYKRIENSYSPIARNTGFRMASGEFVAVIDSDDLWPETKIEQQLNALQDNPSAVILGHVQRFTDDVTRGRIFGATSRLPSQDGDYVQNLLSMEHQQMVNLNTLCAKRSIICADGLWDPAFHTAHDWEVWVRLAKEHPFVHLDSVLQHYRKHRASVTGGEKWQTALNYQLKVVKRHAPTGIANLWKRLTYRKIRYHCYIGILTYENQLRSAFWLWLQAACKSNLILSKAGWKSLVELIQKVAQQGLSSGKANHV